VGFVEAKPSFEPEPRGYHRGGWHSCDVLCGGQPLYVWVAVDAYTRRPIWLGASLTQANHAGRAQVSAQAEEEVSVWVTRLSSRIERGPW